MPNRLANETSPYLLQHKDNPVDWYPWGPEALEQARRQDRPIFLSIGYAACHWCHVMERESFEDAETAALMNKHFVCIKVDREERPDLDNIYMQAVVQLTRHGGWPMSVFLTPDGEPFYGGTYYPPERRYNMPSFREVLAAVAGAWEKDRENLESQADRLTAHLGQSLGGASVSGAAFTVEDLDSAAMKLAQGYDWKQGGWGQAPKFPQPMAIEFLLRKATRGDTFALEMAEHALEKMARGGMYDVVGGGFARYSVDERWLVPHFEKMLYDNAQLSSVYLHAWLLTRKDGYRRVVEQSLEFVMREMADPSGGFHASLDADSEGEEGRFYVWTPEEIAAALPDEDERRLVIAAYGVDEAGNFEGSTVLQRQVGDAELAEQLGLDAGAVPALLGTAHRKLLERRAARVRPATDDKCVAAWNGLMLVAFSEAGRYLESDRYKEVAMRNGSFLLAELREPGTGRLARTWRQGRRGPPGFLEDYASVALGLLALYQTDPDPRWFSAAREIAEEMITLFSDENGGFFDTGGDTEALLVRPKDVQDNATPSGSSLAASLLLMLAAYTGDDGYRSLAQAALSPIHSLSVQHPTAFANWLCAADLAAGPLLEVALVGPKGPDKDALNRILRRSYRPRLITASTTWPAEQPPLLRDRTTLAGKTTAYVCQGFSCQAPTTDPATFASQLDPDDA